MRDSPSPRMVATPVSPPAQPRPRLLDGLRSIAAGPRCSAEGQSADERLNALGHNLLSLEMQMIDAVTQIGYGSDALGSNLKKITTHYSLQQDLLVVVNELRDTAGRQTETADRRVRHHTEDRHS